MTSDQTREQAMLDLLDRDAIARELPEQVQPGTPRAGAARRCGRADGARGRSGARARGGAPATAPGLIRRARRSARPTRP